MFKPLPLYIGLRYTRARHRTQFISIVSLLSLLGMVLGVFALIVVSSVMNGFEAELRGRILSAVPHGFIEGPNQRLADWQGWSEQLEDHPEVVATAPYVSGKVMVSRPGMVRGAMLYAIDPAAEQTVSQVGEHMLEGRLDALQAQTYGVVLGDILARQLGVYMGDMITVMLPRVTVTPLGIFPRSKRFQVVGVFRVGAQLDADSLFIHLGDGQRLFQLGADVQGLRVQLHDLFSAETVIPALAQELSPQASGHAWTQTQGSLFQAVKLEKTMVAILLLVIVAIAAFNIVSILTMMVADKRANIAVLRTMGASPLQVMATFMVQGMTVGLAGTGLGVVLGVPVALYVGDIVAAVERWSGAQVFNPQVYFISRIPSLLQWSDLLWIVGCAMLLSFLATLYPSWRAARVHPAEVLRYE